MAILIEGMEMPKSCEKCLFIDYEDGFCFASGVMRKSGCYEFTLCPGEIKGSRHDDCPLVEIPTPHGRLIDADDIEKRIKMWLDHPDEYIRKRNQDMLHYIQQEDTVIEAEDGE